jgi:uncharacterized protein (TIGR02246 family)
MTTSVEGLSSEDRDAIRATADRFAELVLKQDFDGVVRLYTDDAVFMPPHQPAVRGRKALREWLGAFPRVSRFRFDIKDVDGRSDLAYVHGTYAMTLHPPGAAGSVDDVGKYVEIRKRQADGSWLLVFDIFNSDNA